MTSRSTKSPLFYALIMMRMSMSISMLIALSSSLVVSLPVASFRVQNSRLQQHPSSLFRSTQQQQQQQRHHPRQDHSDITSSSSSRLLLSTTTSTSTMSLIGAETVWGNVAALAGISVLAQTLGNTTAVGKLFGAPVLAMAVTFVGASCGLLAPGGTQTARTLQTLAIQLATPWILLGANYNFPTTALHDTSSTTTSASTNNDNSKTMMMAPMIVAFGCAALATVLGGSLGWHLLAHALTTTLGVGGTTTTTTGDVNHGLAIAAALLAKNIGGGINYIAVASALQASPAAIATGLVIDNIGALVYFPLSNLVGTRYPDLRLPSPRQRRQRTPTNTNTNTNTTQVGAATHKDHDTTTPTTEPEPIEARGTTSNTRSSITVESISIALVLASAVLWLGEMLATTLLQHPSAHIPIVTLLAVVVANLGRPSLCGPRWCVPPTVQTTCDVLGTVCLYLFFTTAGAPGIQIAHSMLPAMLPLALYSTILYGIHGTILAMLYQLFAPTSAFQKRRRRTKRGRRRTYRHHVNEEEEMDGGAVLSKTQRPRPQQDWSWTDVVAPQRLLIASSSAIGGPPTSVALARSVGWKSLEVPALLVGNIGYAVSTFIGIAFYYCFK